MLSNVLECDKGSRPSYTEVVTLSSRRWGCNLRRGLQPTVQAAVPCPRTLEECVSIQARFSSHASAGVQSLLRVLPEAREILTLGEILILGEGRA